MSKYTFTRSAGETFKFSDAALKKLEPKLAAAHEATADRKSAVRVHPEIRHFAANAWSEMTRRLQFETGKPYDACSREIAQRCPWVYLAAADTAEFREYDVDVSEVQE